MKRLLAAAIIFLSYAVFGQGSVRRVDTIDELLKINPSASATSGKLSVEVSGYYAAGDWGNVRTIRWVGGSAVATNAGCVFDSPSGVVGQWIADDCDGEEVDVRWFGATGNGTTDDSVRIQAAIKQASGKSGVVSIPAGSYVIRSDLYATNSVTIKGSHRDSTRLIYYGTNYCLTIGGGTNFLVQNVVVKDIFFVGWADPPYDGSYAPTNAAGMIKVHGATRGRIENVRTSNAITGNGILFLDQAWIWDVLKYQCFDLKYGIKFECKAGVGDLVSAINIFGGEISGCDWGMMAGRHDATLGTAERGIGTINVVGCAIEGNRYGGAWLNQTENANFATYWEGNPETHIRLGNSLDASSWSCSGINIVGNRFATSTNGIQIYAAQNVVIDGNDFQDLKGSGIGITFGSTNHTSVVIGANNRARQSSSTDYNVPVYWLDGHGSVVRQLTDDPVGNSLWKDSANAIYGQDPLTWATTDRLQYFNKYLVINSTNGSVGLLATMLGSIPGTQTRAFLGTDNTNIMVGGRRDSGGLMPIKLTSNGSELMTLDGVQTANPNRLVVGATNGYEKLTVHGNIVMGDPTNYGGFSVFDRQLNVMSRSLDETAGLLIYSYDGTNNRHIRFGIDSSIPEAVLQATYSTGGEIPFIIRAASGNDILTAVNSGITIRNGAGITLGGVTRTTWPSGGGGTNSSTVFVNNSTQIDGPSFNDSSEITVSAAITNITMSIAAGSIASNKLNSVTYNWIERPKGVYVDAGTAMRLDDSGEILFTMSGATSAIAGYVDYSLTLPKIATNTSVVGDILYRSASAWTNLPIGASGKVLKVSGGLPSWQDDSTGGAGSLYVNGTSVTNIKDSSNIVFTVSGSEAIPDLSTNLTLDSLTVTNFTIVNPVPAYAISNATANRFAIWGPDYLLTNDIAETGSGAPVRAVGPALTGNPTAPTQSVGTSNTTIATTAFVLQNSSTNGTTYTFSTGLTNAGGTVSAAIAPGSGVTFTTNSQTITIASTGTSYTFTNGLTNVAGVVSSSLVPGSNITLTTNAGAITIASTASGTAYAATNGVTLTGTNFSANLLGAGTVSLSTNAGVVTITGTSVTNAPVYGLWQTLGGLNCVVTNNTDPTPTANFMWSSVSGIVTNATIITPAGAAGFQRLQIRLDFNQNIGTNYFVAFDVEGVTGDSAADHGLIYWSQDAPRGPTNVSVTLHDEGAFGYAYQGYPIHVRIIKTDATAGGMGGDVITTANNVLTGSNTFNGALMLGTTNLATAIAGKAPLASPALTGTPTINSTNVMAAINDKEPLNANKYQATNTAITALTIGNGTSLTNVGGITTTNIQTITGAVATFEPLNANKYQGTNPVLTAVAASPVYAKSNNVYTGSNSFGTITANNPAAGDNSTNVATTAWVWGALNSLNELRSMTNSAWRYFQESDFLFGATSGNIGFPWEGAAVGSGITQPLASEVNHPSYYTALAAAGATPSGFYFHTIYETCYRLNGLDMFNFVFRPIGTNSGNVLKAGFHDTITAANPVDAFMILRSNNIIRGYTYSNNIATATLTSYSCQSNVWYRGVMATSSDLTVANFALLTGSNTVVWSDSLTNTLPIGRDMGHGITMLGTNSSALDHLDYMAVGVGKILDR